MPLFEEWEASKKESILSDKPEQPKLEELPLYSYETLAIATDTFHLKNKLGTGGFGPVFKVFSVTQELNGLKESMNDLLILFNLFAGDTIKRPENCGEKAFKFFESRDQRVYE